MTTNLRLACWADYGPLRLSLLLLAAVLALGSQATAQDISGSVRFITPKIPGRAAPAPVKPASNEEFLDGPGVVLGERGAVPVPPGRTPWPQRMGAPRVARPKIVKYINDQPPAEELPMGKAHKT